MLALTGAQAPAERRWSRRRLLRAVHCGRRSGLHLGSPPVGLRSYVSVRGGIAVAAGTRFALNRHFVRLGPPPVRAGDLLPVGPPPAGFPQLDRLRAGAVGETLVLHALRGPRDDWLADRGRACRDAVDDLQSTATESGFDLGGEPLQCHASRKGKELPSEGVVRGSIQVPPERASRSYSFLADHPVTGGYPVVVCSRRGCDSDRGCSGGPRATGSDRAGGRSP